MQFKPHGNTAVAREGRLVVFRPQGGGNAEEIGRILHEIERVAPRGERWGALVLMSSGDLLLTPEAERALRDAAPQLAAAGLAALALCGRPRAELWISTDQFQRIFAGLPLHWTVLETPDEARHWLLDRL